MGTPRQIFLGMLVQTLLRSSRQQLSLVQRLSGLNWLHRQLTNPSGPQTSRRIPPLPLLESYSPAEQVRLIEAEAWYTFQELAAHPSVRPPDSSSSLPLPPHVVPSSSSSTSFGDTAPSEISSVSASELVSALLIWQYFGLTAPPSKSPRVKWEQGQEGPSAKTLDLFQNAVKTAHAQRFRNGDSSAVSEKVKWGDVAFSLVPNDELLAPPVVSEGAGGARRTLRRAGSSGPHQKTAEALPRRTALDETLE